MMTESGVVIRLGDMSSRGVPLPLADSDTDEEGEMDMDLAALLKHR